MYKYYLFFATLLTVIPLHCGEISQSVSCFVDGEFSCMVNLENEEKNAPWTLSIEEEGYQLQASFPSEITFQDKEKKLKPRNLFVNPLTQTSWEDIFCPDEEVDNLEGGLGFFSIVTLQGDDSWKELFYQPEIYMLVYLYDEHAIDQLASVIEESASELMEVLEDTPEQKKFISKYAQDDTFMYQLICLTIVDKRAVFSAKLIPENNLEVRNDPLNENDWSFHNSVILNTR